MRGCRTLRATSVDPQHWFDFMRTDGQLLLCLCWHTLFERSGQIYYEEAAPGGGAVDDFDKDDDDDEIE